jgi:hypothetical protein
MGPNMRGAYRERAAQIAAGLCATIMPGPQRQWADAMRREIETIGEPGAAMAYAFGCLAACTKQRLFHRHATGRRTMREREEALAWTGAALILAGAFLPISFARLIGPSAYIDRTFTSFQVGGSPLFGVLIVTLAFVAGSLAWFRRTQHLIWCGAATLCVLAAAYPSVREPLSVGQADAMDAATASFGASWGIFSLLVGSVAMFAAGLLRRRRA